MFSRYTQFNVGSRHSETCARCLVRPEEVDIKRLSGRGWMDWGVKYVIKKLFGEPFFKGPLLVIRYHILKVEKYTLMANLGIAPLSLKQGARRAQFKDLAHLGNHHCARLLLPRVYSLTCFHALTYRLFCANISVKIILVLLWLTSALDKWNCEWYTSPLIRFWCFFVKICHISETKCHARPRVAAARNRSRRGKNSNAQGKNGGEFLRPPWAAKVCLTLLHFLPHDEVEICENH